MITTATARTTPSSINPEMKERPSERDAKRDGHKRRFADQVVERFAHPVEHRGAPAMVPQAFSAEIAA